MRLEQFPKKKLINLYYASFIYIHTPKHVSNHIELLLDGQEHMKVQEFRC